MKTRIMLFIVMLLAAWQGATAQDYFKDTVWTKRTDQMQGFYMVKFSNTDSLIIGHGMEMDLFYDAKTGKEVMRIPGNNEVFFINNDRNFIRTDEARTRIEIFDLKSYQVIDTLENDGNKSTGSISVSKNENYLLSTIPHGFRIWDLNNRKILKTKILQKEQNLIYYEYDYVFFTCDDNKFIAHQLKTYEDPEHPGEEEYYKKYASYNVYDFITLDSIDTFPNSRGMILSKMCKYFALATGDKDYGVEIYDFKTKELIWKLPINGPSLTGIEFSPDDNYLITSGHGIIIWDMTNGKNIYFYPGDWNNIDVTKNGKYIVSSGSYDLWMWHTRFDGTSLPIEIINNKSTIYPNPTNGLAVLEFYQPVSEVTTINLIDINGKISKLILKKYLESGSQSIQFKTNDLLNGSYFIEIKNSHISLTLKLVVNR